MTVLGPKVLADILVSTSEIDVYSLVPAELGSVPGVPNSGNSVKFQPKYSED